MADLRARQQRIDAARLLEGLVTAEADVGRKLEIDRVRDLAADEALMAVQRLDHRLGVAVRPARSRRRWQASSRATSAPPAR